MKKNKSKVTTCLVTKSANALPAGANDIVHKEFDLRITTKKEPDEDGFFRFKGLGSTFGNTDLVDDVMVAGCFTESLLKETPVILWQHDRYEPIGMPELIKETAEGLELDVIMPGDDDFVKGRVMPQLRIGSVKSMSIGFRVLDYHIKDDIRYITKVSLKEVSLVTFPANEQAKVTQVKSLHIKEVEAMTKRDLEKTLREVGFSKEAATFVASKFPEAGDPNEGSNDEAVIKACEKLLGLQNGADEVYANTLKARLEKLLTI